MNRYFFYENGEVWKEFSGQKIWENGDFPYDSITDFEEVGTHSIEIYEYEKKRVFHDEIGAYIIFKEGYQPEFKTLQVSHP